MGLSVHYTIDGTAPGPNSALYGGPISLPRGGTVQAVCLGPDGRLGMMASRNFPGFSPIGWKVVSANSDEAEHPASAAIDGSSKTFWLTMPGGDQSKPHQLIVDMGSVRKIAGFAYLPRQDGSHEGIVESYRFETSADGDHWITNIASERFWNIENNPVQQEASFSPVDARFFRFTALNVLGVGARAGAAEISVIPAEDMASQ
jgi:alpha-L-fucosidase